MITLAHRIQLMPNNKQRTYFRKAIGCARLAYNWGLAEWKRRYDEGDRSMTILGLQKDFRAIRREKFPFTLEVSTYATGHAFKGLGFAFKEFFAHRASYPKFRKKKDGQGGFCIGNDIAKNMLCNINRKAKHLKHTPHNINGKRQYLKIPNLGFVKMTERLRFNGKLLNVHIIQDGDRFYATFVVRITEEEYYRTHPMAASDKKGGIVGIDMGLKEAVTLSDGIAIDNPRITRNHQRKITRLSRQLNKRQHAKNKQERLKGIKQSNNYRKLSRKLGREQRHIGRIRHDFAHKITSILTTHYSAIAIETLNLKGMVKNRRMARTISDVPMFKMRRQIEMKAALNGVKVVVADQFYASSKTCSHCGQKRENLSLGERVYRCPSCGIEINRDLNAALNLRSLIQQEVGADRPELTPADLTALQSRFTLNGIATSKVETGIQHCLTC